MQLHSRLRLPTLTLCAATLCVVCSGCHFGGERNIRAEDLPEHLRYPERANPLQASLTSLGSLPQTEYGIGPGDLLDLSISVNLERDGNHDHSLQVDEDGAISVPQLGRVAVTGLRPEAAATEIQRQLVVRDIFKNPVVTVSIAKQRVANVRVIGAVQKEGLHDLPGSSADLLGALSVAGGLTEDATGQIEILSPGLNSQHADLRSDYANRTDASGVQQAGYKPTRTPQAALQPITVNLTNLNQQGVRKYPLGDGAIVMVRKRDSTPISVRGLVNKPTTFPLSGNGVRVWEAVSRAGGVSNQFANKVVITRQLKNGDPLVIPLLLTDAKSSNQSNILLAPGDVVSVEQTPFTIMGDALRIIRFGVSSNLTRFL